MTDTVQGVNVTESEVDELRATVEQEVRNHGVTWDVGCQTFLASEYRNARIVLGRSVQDVQTDYDSCHVWR